MGLCNPRGEGESLFEVLLAAALFNLGVRRSTEYDSSVMLS